MTLLLPINEWHLSVTKTIRRNQKYTAPETERPWVFLVVFF